MYFSSLRFAAFSVWNTLKHEVFFIMHNWIIEPQPVRPAQIWWARRVSSVSEVLQTTVLFPPGCTNKLLQHLSFNISLNERYSTSLAPRCQVTHFRMSPSLPGDNSCLLWRRCGTFHHDLDEFLACCLPPRSSAELSSDCLVPADTGTKMFNYCGFIQSTRAHPHRLKVLQLYSTFILKAAVCLFFELNLSWILVVCTRSAAAGCFQTPERLFVCLVSSLISLHW